jgi:hypothetical protein
MSNEGSKSLAFEINLIEKEQDARYYCKENLQFSECPFLI